jgi:signal transduction histidine kinase
LKTTNKNKGTKFDNKKFFKHVPIFGIFDFNLFNSKQKNRIGSILNLLLIIMFLSSGLVCIGAIVIAIIQGNLDITLQLALVCMLLFGVYFFLLRKGFLALSSVLTCTSFLGVIVFAMLTGDGTRDVAILLVPLFILISSLLLKRWWFYSLNAVLLSSIAGIGLGEIFGIITGKFSGITTILDILVAMVFMLGTITVVRVLTEILYLTINRVEKSNKEFQNEIKNRIRVEKELIIAQDELEKKVEGRTLEYRKAKEEAEFANKAKSEFLSNVSHEFRTPMHQILSYSKFGVDKIDTVKKEKLLHYFSKIGAIGKNLLSLLNNLLDLSKLESGKMDYDMEDTDLLIMVNEIITNFKSLMKDKELSLKIDKKSDVFKAVCDDFKIRQVIRNFLSNAIKFSKSFNTITISMSLSNISLSRNNQLPAILVAVKDQGVGIPEDELELIFDKFVQSSKTKTGSGGTGLGLAICKEIIDAHNGKIWAENNPDGGATFSFMLPYE